MALVSCPDCSARVSAVAPSCPSCGRPIAQQVVQAQARGTRTVEATGKFWKLIMLVSVVGLIWGVSSAIMASNANASPSSGIAIAVLSFVGLLIGKIGAWWFHG